MICFNRTLFPNHKLTDSLIRQLFMKITLHTGKFLALVKEGRWEYVDRLGVAGAAMVVAVTNERKLLLVEQSRRDHLGSKARARVACVP